MTAVANYSVDFRSVSSPARSHCLILASWYIYTKHPERESSVREGMKRVSHPHIPVPALVCLALAAASPLFLISFPLAVLGDTTKSAPSAAPEKRKPAEFSPVQLIALVRSARVLDPATPVHVTVDNGEATVSTLRSAKATDQDCKIDAVLLAKTIMDAFPKDVSRTKLMFSDSNTGTMSAVTVTTGDVKAYAAGSISKDDLLTSLEITKVDSLSEGKDSPKDFTTEGTNPVAPGPFQHDRQLLSDRIFTLKQNGTGTKPFEDMLGQLEQDSQKPAGEVPSQRVQQEIRDLYHRLNEQEQAIRQAHDIANGKTISTVVQDQEQPTLGPRFGKGHGKGQGQWKAVENLQSHIAAMKRAGQDIQQYAQDLDHIRILLRANQYDQARDELQQLGAKIGQKMHNRQPNTP